LFDFKVDGMKPAAAVAPTDSALCTRTGMPAQTQAAVERATSTYEIIDCAELAKRLSLPESWVRNQTRSRAKNPIPHLKFGRYVRFQWGSPELVEWLERQKT